MTIKAREVLGDCRLALQMLELEQDPAKLRVLWAAAVALVRAVGHVLKSVDCQDSYVRQVSNEFYARWVKEPEHEIFPKFIKHERDNLLKEYRSDVHPLDEVPVVIEMSAISLETGMPHTIREIVQLDENLYRPMLEGPWEGDDCRDVLGEALMWWERELNAIDIAVRKIRPVTS